MPILNTVSPQDISTEEIRVHEDLILNQSSEGISSIQYRSGSTTDNYTPTVSGSYWSSLRVNFYLSASQPWKDTKWENSRYSLGYPPNSDNPQHRNKFYSSGSVISIPQKYFGEEIKPGSFTLTDKSTSETIKIEDDGFGNLYAIDASITQSNTSISSSDNYVGNIFYNLGIATVTETGLFSASISYTDVTTGNYDLSFSGTKTIYEKTIKVTAKGRGFSMTNNPTARAGTEGSASGRLRNSLTSSMHNQHSDHFGPYMTTIGLFGKSNKFYPIFKAKYPQPIKMRKNLDIIFKLRIDF
tara:strand:- start:231 stop:1127 length:897 start_codon:yes stop_codon:yes gene_type:complete